MTKERVLVPLAEGFEETEAIAIIDVLRRAELDVVSASLGEIRVRGAHDIIVEADQRWEDVELDTITALVLPGGMPGTLHLRDDGRVVEFARRLASRDLLVAAVCAAPMVLAAAGVLDGDTPFTCHPSVRDKIEGLSASTEPRVIRSGNVITSQGPGTAIEFALAVVEHLVSAERAQALAGAMLVLR